MRGAELSPKGIRTNWYNVRSKRKMKCGSAEGCRGKERKQLDRSSLLYQQQGKDISMASLTEE